MTHPSSFSAWRRSGKNSRRRQRCKAGLDKLRVHVLENHVNDLILGKPVRIDDQIVVAQVIAAFTCHPADEIGAVIKTSSLFGKSFRTSKPERPTTTQEPSAAMERRMSRSAWIRSSASGRWRTSPLGEIFSLGFWSRGIGATFRIKSLSQLFFSPLMRSISAVQVELIHQAADKFFVRAVHA